MKGLLPWFLVLLAVLAMTASAQDMSDKDMDEMTTKVLKALDRQVDRLGQDAPVDDDDEAPRSSKVVTQMKSFGKKMANLIKDVWKRISTDRIKKAVKSTIKEVKNTIKEKGKDLQTKLIKEGKKQAKSFLKHEILKFIKKKAAKDMCDCPEKHRCSCCMKIAGLENGCFDVTALPEEKKFRVHINYGGEKIVSRKIAGVKEMMSCTHLPTPLNLVEICIVTQGITQIDDSAYKGCFRIVSHGLECAKCILFENGKAGFV